MFHGLFIHSSSGEHVGFFLVWEILNKAAVNILLRFCVNISFQLLWVNTKESDSWIIWLEYIQCCKKPSNCLLKNLCDFASPHTMNDNSCYSTSQSTFEVISVPHFDCSHKWLVVFCYHLIDISLMTNDLHTSWQTSSSNNMRQLYTWTSSDGQQQKQIYYMLCN